MAPVAPLWGEAGAIGRFGAWVIDFVGGRPRADDGGNRAGLARKCSQPREMEEL